MANSLSSSLDVPYAPVRGMLCPNDRILDRRQEARCTPIVYVAPNAECDEVLIQTAGWEASVLEAPEMLPSGENGAVPSCLILDISWPNSNDLAFYKRFISLHPEIPVVCMTGDVDLGLVVSIVKAGSYDVIRKPVAEAAFLDSVRRALLHSEAVLEQDVQRRAIKNRYETLSHRERQIMTLLFDGLLNKQVAAELGISEITVKAHRGRVMRKMQARSFASLIKMATLLEL